MAAVASVELESELTPAGGQLLNLLGGPEPGEHVLDARNLYGAAAKVAPGPGAGW